MQAIRLKLVQLSMDPLIVGEESASLAAVLQNAEVDCTAKSKLGPKVPKGSCAAGASTVSDHSSPSTCRGPSPCSFLLQHLRSPGLLSNFLFHAPGLCLLSFLFLADPLSIDRRPKRHALGLCP